MRPYAIAAGRKDWRDPAFSGPGLLHLHLEQLPLLTPPLDAVRIGAPHLREKPIELRLQREICGLPIRREHPIIDGEFAIAPVELQLSCKRRLLFQPCARRDSRIESLPEILLQAFDAAVAACARLEQEPAFAGKLKFDWGDCEFSINDRMLAPNREATYLALKPEFDRFLAEVWGADSYSIERRGEERELFQVQVKKSGA